MILINDFKAEPKELIDAQTAAARKVFESGYFILGEQVKKFEAAWAKKSGTAFCAGVANGMDAIEVGLRALNIGPGDEVITTGMTAFATVLAVLRAGATPVLADINASTGLLDVNSVERCLTPKTKAVLLVHLYGQVREMPQWQNFCSQNRILLLEDCAQAHLAKDSGRTAGSFGTFGAYSFYPTKNLGAIGDAGAIVSNNQDIDQKVRMLRNYGQSERYHHPVIGLNSRMDELHAAILTERLKWLPQFTERRQAIAGQYFDGFQNSKVTLMAKPLAIENHCYHLFVVKTADRDGMMAHLKAKGVASLSHYPIPVHHQVSTKDIRRDPNGLARTETHAESCLSIPCHPQMAEGDVQKVIDAVNSY